MLEHNKVLLRRAVAQVWNGANFAIADELLAGDVVHTSTSAEVTIGPEAVKQYFAMLHVAFPDIHFTIEDQVAAGDRAVTRWTARGTHRGRSRGFPRPASRCRLAGIAIDRVAGSTVGECWSQADGLGLLHQLGVLPTPEQGRCSPAGRGCALPSVDLQQPVRFGKRAHRLINATQGDHPDDPLRSAEARMVSGPEGVRGPLCLGDTHRRLQQWHGWTQGAPAATRTGWMWASTSLACPDCHP
jgi:predicted ester cyclase